MTLVNMALVVMFFPVIIIVACGFVYAIFKISVMAWLFLFSMCGCKWAENKLENM
jgi:uncharacterized membrane protein YqjE